MPAAPALRLDLKPSRLLAGALVSVHGLAGFAAWISLSGWVQYLAWGAILASLAQALLRAAHPALSLELNEDGRASWRNRDGIWHEGRLGRSHFVSAALAVLELETARLRRRKRVILMADSVSPEDFRRLRVWLRWRRSPAQSRPQ
jgi:toxin CptA